MQNYKILEKKLKAEGYCTLKFENNKDILHIKNLIEKKIRKITKISNLKLTEYHKYIKDTEHTKIQWEIANFFWQKKLHHKALGGLSFFLKYLYGGDLLIQKKPFLRIARPFEQKDNIGFHKDTLYGQSPYELSIHVPLVNLDAKSCLKFVPKSFMLDEKKLKFLKNSNNEHTKGSKKHKLGYPYDPKTIDTKNETLKKFSSKVGEAVIFTPALIHGQEMNKSKNLTRFSFDLRITSLHSPINHKLKSFNGDYDRFSISPIEEISQLYYKKNK